MTSGADIRGGVSVDQIAAKEFGDHLLSVRFIVLLIVLGLAAIIPLYFAADRIRSLAPQATGVPAIFLALFTVGSQDIGILRVDAFVAMVAPLLGLAFAFDAVNLEFGWFGSLIQGEQALQRRMLEY